MDMKIFDGKNLVVSRLKNFSESLYLVYLFLKCIHLRHVFWFKKTLNWIWVKGSKFDCMHIKNRLKILISYQKNNSCPNRCPLILNLSKQNDMKKMEIELFFK